MTETTEKYLTVGNNSFRVSRSDVHTVIAAWDASGEFVDVLHVPSHVDNDGCVLAVNAFITGLERGILIGQEQVRGQVRDFLKGTP